DMNRCLSARITVCLNCFSIFFCLSNKKNFFMFRGTSFDECLRNFFPMVETLSCVKYCKVGQWFIYGKCTRINTTTWGAWGLEETRVQIIKKPSKDRIPAPTTSESTSCTLGLLHCRNGKRTGKKKKKRKEKKKRKYMESKESQHSQFLPTERANS
uniref:R-spondin Fu-CRD domain-containing protein n=1 Tax=Callithrix jacchus TaxID=9483 RepID=A0A8I3WCJ2_CALJA